MIVEQRPSKKASAVELASESTAELHEVGGDAPVRKVIAARLDRLTFRTSRLLDFCSRRELITQTGHPPEDWPLVILKELVDNALDACEDANIQPHIVVTVDANGINVTDNGPGIPATTVDALLDFSVLVSSRNAYISPTRGAQGNALKTVLAMPFVLDGERGEVKITSCGVCHIIGLGVDRIRQQPVIEHATVTDEEVKSGTRVAVAWPHSACSILGEAKAQFLLLVADYAWLNPHLTLTVEWFGCPDTLPATLCSWGKWMPSNPTSPHWYTSENLDRLLAAYISHDADTGKDRGVGEFVAGFAGLSGSAKKKTVLAATGLARTSLAELARDGDIDRNVVTRLLAAMQEASKPVKPEALGVIGRDHMRSRMDAAKCAPSTFAYRKITGETNGVPWVVEVAFSALASALDGGNQDGGRRMVCGVNFSPAIITPFRDLNGISLDELLESREAGQREPVVLAVHVTCARAEFSDRGKSAVVLPRGDDGGPADAIVVAVDAVTKSWAKQRKSEQRDASRQMKRREVWNRAGRVTIKDAAAAVMEEAYLKASGGGTLPAAARQVMYAARRAIQEMTRKMLDDAYFTQTLLPDYIADHPEKTADWDVVFDARGHFTEPHTGVVVPIGTLEVRDYLNGTEDDPSLSRNDLGRARTDYHTRGPRHRYGAVLFIEKEGFMPLFERVNLAERYDIAIMSTKGMSVTAARALVDRLCEGDVPLLVLHDFDKSGFIISSTLQRDTRRYAFKNNIRVIDFGLRLEDVEKWGLDSEDVHYGKSDPRQNLRDNGATDDEVEFLCSGGDSFNGYRGKRVELNAFTADKLVAWIESKLKKHGINKLVPGANILEDAYRRAVAAKYINSQISGLQSKGADRADHAKVPFNLAATVRNMLKENRVMSWDEAVATIVPD